MKFQKLLALTQNDPLFETGLLLTGDVEAKAVRKQLSRWKRSGRVLQVRRGLYSLAPPYQKERPHPFLIANRLTPGSYVSLQSALAYHDLIPEHVIVTTSVGNVRPGLWQTPLGDFLVRHIKPELLWGYERREVTKAQYAFVALPEKALLDLLYLEPGSASPAYVQELRLQNLESLNITRLTLFAQRANSPKLGLAAKRIANLADQESEYELL